MSIHRKALCNLVCYTLVLFLCATFTHTSQACTDILLKSKEGPVHSRIMDFAIPLFASPFSVERGKSFQSRGSDGKAGLVWTNKYAYVGMESPIMARGDALDGLNEVGLSVAALWLRPTVFPKNATGSNALASTQLISYLLGTAKNVPELKKALRGIAVWGEELKGLGGVPTVHLA